MAFDDINKAKKIGIYRKSFVVEATKKDEKPKISFIYYYYHNDKPVLKKDMDRINKLGIPPAYTDVWISIDPNSKIQATGYDDRGRKQYRYHTKHIKDAERSKFLKMYKFIKVLPKLDKKITNDYNQLKMYGKNTIIAFMLLLINKYNIRVGKECYSQANNSYGITSLKKTHLYKLENGNIQLKFKAKSNKNVSYTIKDKKFIDLFNELLKLDGEKLFQYIKEDGSIYKVNDTDLNKYIQSTIGKEFTTKDLRTYSANINFIIALLNETKKNKPITKTIIKSNLDKAQESTANSLKHTKNISKKSYTVSLIRELYLTNTQWFIDNIKTDPINLLTQILKIYKENG